MEYLTKGNFAYSLQVIIKKKKKFTMHISSHLSLFSELRLSGTNKFLELVLLLSELFLFSFVWSLSSCTPDDATAVARGVDGDTPDVAAVDVDDETSWLRVVKAAADSSHFPETTPSSEPVAEESAFSPGSEGAAKTRNNKLPSKKMPHVNVLW